MNKYFIKTRKIISENINICSAISKAIIGNSSFADGEILHQANIKRIRILSLIERYNFFGKTINKHLNKLIYKRKINAFQAKKA